MEEPTVGLSLRRAATVASVVMGRFAMGARKRFMAPVMEWKRRRVSWARTARSAFASVAVGGGGVGFGFRWCWPSARRAGMLLSRKRVRRRRMALRKDSLDFGGARMRLSKMRAARHK